MKFVNQKAKENNINESLKNLNKNTEKVEESSYSNNNTHFSLIERSTGEDKEKIEVDLFSFLFIFNNVFLIYILIE